MMPTTQEAYDLAGSNFYNPNWGGKMEKKETQELILESNLS